MTTYKIPDNEILDIKKNKALALVRYYTFRDGFLDISKINPKTIITRFHIENKEVEGLINELISEGKVIKSENKIIKEI